MRRGNLRWFQWYLRQVAAGRALLPETHELAQRKIDAELVTQGRVVAAMRKARAAQRGRVKHGNTDILPEDQAAQCSAAFHGCGGA